MADVNRAGMIVFNRAGEVLVCSALGRPNIWVFPKGHIEKGEESWQAAEREAFEECRVHATGDWSKPVGVQAYTYKGEEIVCEWWSGLAIESVAPPEEGDEISWGFRAVKFVPWRTALDLLSFPDLRNMLRRALCLPEVEPGKVTLTDPKEVSSESSEGEESEESGS